MELQSYWSLLVIIALCGLPSSSPRPEGEVPWTWGDRGSWGGCAGQTELAPGPGLGAVCCWQQ